MFMEDPDPDIMPKKDELWEESLEVYGDDYGDF
jgi:hypothetical protein